MALSPELFTDFLLSSGALTFGDFTTKSGRKTPYFINTGTFHTGPQLALLGEAYAGTILDQMGPVDVVFGPAYKGIPLAVAAATALAEDGLSVSYSSLRKEAKDHGDTGSWLGHIPTAKERVVIVEDVTTAGTSVRESMPALLQTGCTVVGLVIAVDRQERGTEALSALTQISQTYGI
ncbi:MAG: orotate phosphoribosyltransferase, partial [Propionibacteriaceae bacterium]